MMKKFLLASGLVILSACSGGSTTELAISMNDRTEDEEVTSFYEPAELKVATGEKVSFQLSNAGTLPHNARMSGPDGEYNTADDTIVGPELLPAGGDAVFEWTAPDQPATIEFRCDFHLNTGTITVE